MDATPPGFQVLRYVFISYHFLNTLANGNDPRTLTVSRPQVGVGILTHLPFKGFVRFAHGSALDFLRGLKLSQRPDR
jgi:hypothetical protein